MFWLLFVSLVFDSYVMRSLTTCEMSKCNTFFDSVVKCIQIQFINVSIDSIKCTLKILYTVFESVLHYKSILINLSTLDDVLKGNRYTDFIVKIESFMNT